MTFHDLFQFSMTLVLARRCHFQKFSQLLLILVIFSTCLFNYVSLSYFVLALISAVTNLPNITSIFHHSPWLTFKFHDFLRLENEILKFNDFPGFSMTCTNPAIHVLFSSSKRMRHCGLKCGISTLSFPKLVDF